MFSKILAALFLIGVIMLAVLRSVNNRNEGQLSASKSTTAEVSQAILPDVQAVQSSPVKKQTNKIVRITASVSASPTLGTQKFSKPAVTDGNKMYPPMAVTGQDGKRTMSSNGWEKYKLARSQVQGPVPLQVVTNFEGRVAPTTEEKK